MDDDYPAEWGAVTTALMEIDAEDGSLDVTDWVGLVMPPADGDFHHGSEGSIPHDTVLLLFEEQEVARCDCGHFAVMNYYAYDGEYYFFIRLREVLVPEAWARTPWADAPLGGVLAAWDKFHGLEYYFGELGEDDTLSFGGDWDDLQNEVAERFPIADGPAIAPTPAALMSAIERDDLEGVRDLLARSAPTEPRAEATAAQVPSLLFSHARDRDPAWEAICRASVPVLAALLDAGVAVDRQPPGAMALVHGAIVNDRPAHLALLLERGASLNASWQGKSAREMASERGGEVERVVGEFLASGR